MKKLATLIIILFTSYAALATEPDKTKVEGPPHQDVVKIFTPVLHSDSSIVLVNLIESYKIITVKSPSLTNRADSIKVLASLYSMVSPKLSNAIEQQQQIKALSTANRIDTLATITYAYGAVNSRLSAALNQEAGFRDVDNINNLKLLSAAFGSANENFSDAIHQRDSIRLIEVARVESLRQHLKYLDLDSLKHELKTNQYEALKLALYTEIAARYLNYDTISNRKVRLNYQNEAISYTMLALHKYSRFNDTVGLRTCFDNLAKVYFAQKKYSQAKWFILQSNTISRIKKDTLNVIASLITLSSIKCDIKDYTLAKKDLNDALLLSIKKREPKAESAVLKNFALLYSRLKNYPKEALILKQRDSLEEKIHKDEETLAVAKVAAKDSLQVKKIDSLQGKKKVFTSATRKLYKSNSPRKIASL